MAKVVKYYFFLLLIFLPYQVLAYQDFNILKAEVTGRAVILDNDIEKAKRLALEDALYLASLQEFLLMDFKYF